MLSSIEKLISFLPQRLILIMVRHKSSDDLMIEIHNLASDALMISTVFRGPRGKYNKKKMSKREKSKHRRKQNRIAQRNRRKRIKVSRGDRTWIKNLT